MKLQTFSDCLSFQRISKIVALSAILAIITGDSLMAIDEPSYKVINEFPNNIEIRQYDSYIIAMTTVSGDFESAGNQAFRRLFQYISGANISQKKIAMTAPVGQVENGTKIAMTAPVGQIGKKWKWNIFFVMPPGSTLDNLPNPKDSRIELIEIKAQKMAAIRFSGSWDQENFTQKENELKAFLTDNNLKANGDPVLARYNAPFSLWFLRRNEVLIPIGN